MKGSLKYILAALCILAVFSIALLAFRKEAPGPAPEKGGESSLQAARAPSRPSAIRLGTGTLNLEYADTEEKMMRGLSGRESLPAGTGLLFVPESPTKLGIWMKDMKFSIDVFWLDENLTIITVVENMSPESFPRAYYPGRAASYVLETNAGFAREHGVKAGSEAAFVKE